MLPWLVQYEYALIKSEVENSDNSEYLLSSKCWKVWVNISGVTFTVFGLKKGYDGPVPDKDVKELNKEWSIFNFSVIISNSCICSCISELAVFVVFVVFVVFDDIFDIWLFEFWGIIPLIFELILLMFEFGDGDIFKFVLFIFDKFGFDGINVYGWCVSDDSFFILFNFFWGIVFFFDFPIY